MSNDRQKSDVFAQRRYDRGLSRLREGCRPGTIRPQENSWPVRGLATRVFLGFSTASLGVKEGYVAIRSEGVGHGSSGRRSC